MNKVIKTVLIIITVIVSVCLLCTFLLYNFPYSTLINRINNELQKGYGISLSAEDVRYGYPFRVILRDVEITRRKENFKLAADVITIRMRLLNFKKYKVVEINGTGISVSNSFIEASGGFMQITSNINVIRMLRSDAVHQIRSVLLQAGGMDVERISFSGFEFSSLKLQQMVIELAADEKGFSIQRGVLKADVVQSELTGTLDDKSMDVIVSVSLTKEFYDRFKDLKGLVDSFFKNGKLRMHIRGDWQSPQVEFIKK